MKIESITFKVQTRGNSDTIDITPEVEKVLSRSKMKEGLLHLFVVGSTAGITTVEYEPGLVQDLKKAFERIAPSDGEYAHHERWNDDNGHSHVRASLLGPSISVPFHNGKMLLGTWQQLVLIDFDTRSREREIVVQVQGE